MSILMAYHTKTFHAKKTVGQSTPFQAINTLRTVPTNTEVFLCGL